MTRSRIAYLINKFRVLIKREKWHGCASLPFTRDYNCALFYLQLYPALPGCEDWKTGPPTKYPQLNKQLQSREVQNSWPVLLLPPSVNSSLRSNRWQTSSDRVSPGSQLKPLANTLSLGKGSTWAHRHPPSIWIMPEATKANPIQMTQSMNTGTEV